MATAKKAAAKKTPRKASAAEVDDILGGDDTLAPKKGGKKAAKKTAPKKARGGGGTSAEARAYILKVKKLTSYQDIAAASGYNIRLIRRTSRAMDDEGLVERQKDGTLIYVRAKK